MTSDPRMLDELRIPDWLNRPVQQLELVGIPALEEGQRLVRGEDVDNLDRVGRLDRDR